MYAHPQPTTYMRDVYIPTSADVRVRICTQKYTHRIHEDSDTGAHTHGHPASITQSHDYPREYEYEGAGPIRTCVHARTHARVPGVTRMHTAHGEEGDYEDDDVGKDVLALHPHPHPHPHSRFSISASAQVRTCTSAT
ncbi:hypothetical protein B0H13DRAFT_1905766 [Mycena leptocephala]|nr:hypothetical protein B0H13DRAFT_1905766 [Mycena leptocephala]